MHQQQLEGKFCTGGHPALRHRHTCAKLEYKQIDDQTYFSTEAVKKLVWPARLQEGGKVSYTFILGMEFRLSPVPRLRVSKKNLRLVHLQVTGTERIYYVGACYLLTLPFPWPCCTRMSCYTRLPDSRPDCRRYGHETRTQPFTGTALSAARAYLCVPDLVRDSRWHNIWSRGTILWGDQFLCDSTLPDCDVKAVTDRFCTKPTCFVWLCGCWRIGR